MIIQRWANTGPGRSHYHLHQTERDVLTATGGFLAYNEKTPAI
jgi:hypothetical protein